MGKTIKNVDAAVNRQHFSKEFKLEAVRLLELAKSLVSESIDIC